MGDTRIRPARAEDLPALLEIEQCIIDAERPYNERTKKGRTHYYDLAGLIDDDASLVLVAETGGRIVGTGYARIRTSEPYLVHEQHAYLGFMYVDPAYRGQGLNRLIVDALIEWSRTRGMTDVYLDAYCDNLAAIRAYEKAGFCKSVVEMRLSLAR